MIKCYNGGKLGLQEDECSVIEFGNKTIAVVDTAAYKISAVTSLLDDETLKREWVLGKRIGPKILSIYDSGLIEGSGYTPYDDEGSAASKT